MKKKSKLIGKQKRQQRKRSCSYLHHSNTHGVLLSFLVGVAIFFVSSSQPLLNNNSNNTQEELLRRYYKRDKLQPLLAGSFLSQRSGRSDNRFAFGSHNHLPRAYDEVDRTSHRVNKGQPLDPASFQQWKARLQQEKSHVFQGFLFHNNNSSWSSRQRFPWCHAKSDTMSADNKPLSPPSTPRQGLLLSKTFKTASSTAAAVTMHVARRVAQLYFDEDVCSYEVRHEPSLAGAFRHRDLHRSFLWTTLRQPHARAISAYLYYAVTLLGLPPSPDDLVAYLEATKDQMIQQLQLQSSTQERRARLQESFGILLPYAKKSSSSTSWHKHVGHHRDGGGVLDESAEPQPVLGRLRVVVDGDKMNAYTMVPDIVSQYNFMCTVERWDECMIVLLILLGLLDPRSSKGTSPQELEALDAILSHAVVLSSKQSKASQWAENWILDVPAPGLQRRLRRVQSILPISSVNVSREDGCRSLPSQEMVDTLVRNPRVQHYLQNNYTLDNVDALLYNYVNRSFDATIEKHFRDNDQQDIFSFLVARFRRLQERAEAECRPLAAFPCQDGAHRLPKQMSESNKTHHTKDCYFRDMGCGYACLNRLFPLVS